METNESNENKSDDPRWIALRVSRINVGVIVVGALLALAMIYLLRELSAWIRYLLLAGLLFSMAWDLRQTLLKARNSVVAFYLFDLDAPADDTANADTPKLGMHIRFANAGSLLAAPEREGVVLRKAFVSPWFTAMRYRLPDDPVWRRWWPKVIALWPDSLDVDEFRKIRVALNWK